MHILVTGGTGALGRDLVKRLLDSGHQVRILSRKPTSGDDWVQGDLITGAGLEAAVTGIDAIVHTASATKQPQKVQATDVLGTRRLLAMAREAGVRHAVYVSIVGIDDVPYPYYKAKLAAEAIVRENIVPWSILRATQFHTFMEFILGAFSKVPRLTIVPFKWQFQPVDTHDVSSRLADVVTGEPKGMLPDFGGPEVRDFKSIAESWLKANSQKKRLVNFEPPMKASRLVAEGRLTCPDHKDGTITFEQYLERRYAKPA
jgi:uncharacterized protein YbjT (DUF2867 family)